MTIEAVLFDFGGVLTTSPFENFASYERRHGLPSDLIRRINATNPDANAWAQLERSEVSPAEFARRFEAEARALGHEVSGTAVLECIATEVRPFMVDALERVHERFMTAMLTNNFTSHAESMASESGPFGSAPAEGRQESSGTSFAAIASHFDHIIESAVVGVRKPDPEIYRLTCDTMGVEPEGIVFLDDLGVNLKPARAMGMTTIKVVDPWDALAELEGLLGLSLSSR